ncbi:protocadherin gamma-A11-like isoform X24 [Anguilla rostrata]|uniref:protocadherin gamma-A11-like isoform X24 n=1 Tax=Anguilla rostrata TaxID=7938 RepID=UPI0030D01D85
MDQYFGGKIFWAMKRQVLFSTILLCVTNIVLAQIRYSIPEEMPKGSFVGNFAKDLGVDIKRMISGKARIVAGLNSEYILLDVDKGELVVMQRIDREKLCEQTVPCSISFELVLENPLEMYQITVEILDINDNPPTFPRKEIKLEISESAQPGARFVLDNAMDPDVGINSLQGYSLNPRDYFDLKVNNVPDGSRYVEMVLKAPLDWEKEREHSLLLTAVDGGSPRRSGTLRVHVTVLDANDNSPVFSQAIYKASIQENSAKGTLVTVVNATDADEGGNSKITYSITHLATHVGELFEIDAMSGEIKVSGHIDYEMVKRYEVNVQAKDQGGLTDSCKIIIEVTDVNDNAPVITLTSLSNPIPENASPGTVVAIINVQDMDSEKNGEIVCAIGPNLPFKIKKSLSNYYSLVTDTDLDREKYSDYNISITARDGGTPPLSSHYQIVLQVSDVNDNAPYFEKTDYLTSVMENNAPGLSIFLLQARDDDWGPNARISYFLEDVGVNGSPVSSYISVNSDTGVIYAVRSLDYEKIKRFQVHIIAQDGGSPPLRNNATVTILIQDQNDNAPQILYPVQTGGSLVAEMVPRSADVGYLVTKVVAVDVDSGQNAWLSYKLLKATDRALFEVGLQNGEIRTLRQVTDKDAVKQRLTVVVEDNGRPSRSATVNVNVALADSFPEVLSEFTEFTHEKDYNGDLTFYLVLALAVVSFLFISSLVVIISVKVYRWRQSRIFFQSNLPVIPYCPPRYADAGGTGTLQHVYNYELYRTTDSRKSDIKYLRPISQSLMSVDIDGTETMPKETMSVEGADQPTLQKPPNTDWRFSQNQRPGTSGQHKYNTTQIRWTPYGKARAAPPPEAAVGTGPWPNPPTEAEQLQALMAAANEVSEATATLGPGTMGLSTRYSPQFTLQHVPDYRQNVYIPGSTATLTANQQQQQQQQQQPPQPALPQPPPQAEAPKAAQTPASKKKSAKKDKK